MAIIVVGIDPSLTSTGIAVLLDGQPTTLRAIGHNNPNGHDYAHRSDRIVSQTRTVIRLIENTCLPDLAVIEGPAYGANLPSHYDRAGLFWGLYSTLRARRIPAAVVAPKTRALWATGNGNADKPMVLAALRAHFPNIRIGNHDIADAAALATLGTFWLSHGQLCQPEKPRQIAAAQTVKWPNVERQP